MKKKDFKDLLTSIDQARKIHRERLKPKESKVKKKIGSFTIKITTKYLLLRTTNYILLAIAWLNPWRLIIAANCGEDGWTGLSLLNFGLSFGYIPYKDTTGIDLRLEILGKGFTYTKEYYPDIIGLPAQEHFRWIK